MRKQNVANFRLAGSIKRLYKPNFLKSSTKSNSPVDHKKEESPKYGNVIMKIHDPFGFQEKKK